MPYAGRNIMEPEQQQQQRKPDLLQSADEKLKEATNNAAASLGVKHEPTIRERLTEAVVHTVADMKHGAEYVVGNDRRPAPSV